MAVQAEQDKDPAKDLAKKTGEGAPNPNKVVPLTPAYVPTPSEQEARDAGAPGGGGQPAVSSYDGKNKFQVPLSRNPAFTQGTGPAFQGFAQYSGGGSVQFGDYDVAMNSGFLSAPDDLRVLVADAAGGDLMKYDTVYKEAVYRASMARQAGDLEITVESVLRGWQKSGYPNKPSGGGGGPFSTTSRSVQLTDGGSARQILNGALTRFLGREATDIEQRAFLKSLNVNETNNPTVSVTKGSRSGQNTTSSTNTTGGFNRDDFADRFAKSQEGYAEYQTATTYLDAFIESLQDPTRAI